jgi:hypothetical protein
MENIHTPIKREAPTNLFIILAMGLEEIIMLHLLREEIVLSTDGEIKFSSSLEVP